MRGIEIQFTHERLEVWQVSREMCCQAKRLAGGIPRGHGALADQLKRAAMSCSLLIAEGAYRRGRKDKAHRYTLACAEAGEAAAAVQIAVAMGLVEKEKTSELLSSAHRVVGMLTKLVRRFG